MENYNDQEVSVTDPDAKAQVTWVAELQAAHKEFEEFHSRGDKILEHYGESKKVRRARKYPLFGTNVSILENALFARIPRPDVARRFKDADDQVGRVAALIIQRALITELEGTSEFKNTAKAIIKDMLVPGAGIGWVRYSADIENPVQLSDDENAELAEQPTASPIIKDQQTPIEYIHWKDVRWSPCRTWNEARWVARRVFLNEEEAEERFGEKAKWLSFTAKPSDSKRTSDDNGVQNNTEPQVEVWEIWDKTTKQVYFICEQCPTALDIKPDFLGLPDFFPTEAPLFANSTTSSFMPIADYTILQDQYNELNEVNSRISRLIRACRLAGVYDETQPHVKLLLDGGSETQLIPVKGFSGFAEKGGLKGSIDFMPIGEVAGVLQQLNAQREAIKQQIYELTGISDIVRGESNPYETAAAQGMKAQYSSIRLQGKQTDVAQYLTGLIQRKAFLMLKFYEPQRLLERAGTLTQADQQFIGPAMQLLQNELLTSLKLEVSSDSLQQPNWKREQAERSQTVTSLSQFMQQAVPAVKEIPELGPLMLKVIGYSIAGQPGAADIEGEIQAGLQKLLASQNNQQPKPPSPEQQAQQHAQEQAQQQAQAQQAQAQAQMQFEQQKHAADTQAKQAELAFKQQQAAADMQFKREQAAAELQFKREIAMAELQLKREVEMAKAAQKPMPTVVQGNMGLDESQVVQAMAELQQTTLQALAAIANQPQEPATVTVTRNANGDLVGSIH